MIEELKIILDTNIPEYNDTEVIFKRSMLYNPLLETPGTKLNEYPYFSFNVKYSDKFIQKMVKQDRINLFFNRVNFTNMISRSLIDNNETKIVREQSDYYEKRAKNIEHNIMTMLDILFPTQFPVIGDLNTSYNFIQKNSNMLSKILINPIIDHYSYLKLPNGKIYTFKKVIWLNDILNHPKYNKFMSDYIRFNTRITDDIGDTLNDITLTYQDVSNKIDDVIIKFIDVLFLLEKSITFRKKNQDQNETIKVTSINKQLLDKVLTPIMYLRYFLDNVTESTKIKDHLKSLQKSQLKKIINKYMRNNKLRYYEEHDDYNFTIKDLIKNEFTMKELIQHLDVIPKGNPKGKRQSSDSSHHEFGSIFQITEGKQQQDVYPDTDEEHSLLREINNIVIQIKENPFESSINKYINMSLLKKIPQKNVEEAFTKKKQNIPAEYRNFTIAIAKVRPPQRTSTNITLQEILDGANATKVREFFEYFDIVYKFMKNESIGGESKKLKQILNVGLCMTNTNRPTETSQEIYIMADFIEGEVNSANRSNVYCPYMNDHLGNELEYLIKSSNLDSNTINNWSVKQNRNLFMLKTMNSTTSITGLENTQINQNTSLNQPVNFMASDNKPQIYANAVQPQKNTSLPNDVTDIFFQKIISASSKIKSDIQSISSINRTNQTIDETNLLTYIMQNNKELYDIITKCALNDYEKKNDLITNIINIQGKYKSSITDNEYQQDLPINAEKKGQGLYIFQNALYTLYFDIASQLLTVEKGKSGMTGGNKHTRRNGNITYRIKRNTKKRR